jgi:hypothetical protein
MYDNEYYGSPNDYRNYLSHHGIKGQKWGVMHGPPYPLGSHTSAMIKKGKKVAAKAKKTYDKKIKPKVNDLAKKGSDFYEKNMPEKGKQVINKAAKKTKEVYYVNKELAKKGISNYKSNYDSTKNDLKTKSVLSGTDSPKEDVKEPLDTSKMAEWEKKRIKGGYVVNNPSGFEKGTKYEHLEYDKYTSDTWTIEDKESIISIDKTAWDKSMQLLSLPGHEPKNRIELSTKEISNLQKSLIKNKKAIFSDVANSMAVEMIGYLKDESIMQYLHLPESSLTKDKIASRIMKDPTFTPSIRAIPVSHNGTISMEVTFGDDGLFANHMLTKEVFFDPKTNKWKVSDVGFQMDG